MTKKTFFSKDKTFYKTFFGMMIFLAGQEFVAYSVNMLDNVMLGSYSQAALSGATIVNNVFFIVSQMAAAVGAGLVALASQYWGQKRLRPIRIIVRNALIFGLAISGFLTLLCIIIPEPILRIFNNDPEIISEGLQYLAIIVWTFILYTVSAVLMAALRAVGTVKISFVTSVVSLVVNACINYVLIFGHLGFEPMGARGAAIGTIVSRIIELGIIIVYLVFFDKKLRLFADNTGNVTASAAVQPENGENNTPEEICAESAALSDNISSRVLWKDFLKIDAAICFSSLLWSIATPLQTAILGHLSSDAIAANSVAITFYQLFKVIINAMSSTSGTVVGVTLGRGDIEEVKAESRTLAVINTAAGFILALIIFLLKNPLLAIYKDSFTPNAISICGQLILVMSVVMFGMSYQKPVCYGIMQGCGDTKFAMCLNIISSWIIVIPFSIIAAFVLKLPEVWVVFILQSDQIFKGLPVFLRFRTYKWIKKLTR